MTSAATARYGDAARLANALAAEYRAVARQMVTEARRIERAPITELAKTPVKYVHPRTRKLEDALDDALMAL